VIVLTAEGRSGAEIASMVGIAPEVVSRIRRRFVEHGVEGLADQPKAGRKDHAVKPEVVECIVQMALSPPPAGRTRWTTRLIGDEVDLTSATVAKVLRANGLKPHLVRTYKVSRDPAFAAKVTDVVGLYLNPPQNAIVLSVDEKTQIQALERTQLPLPLCEGRARRHTHDYKRHGVVDLYAALNVANGEVTHRCTDSHTAKDFLRFMKHVARHHPRQELDVVLDNSSTHGGGEGVAREESSRALPLHADERVVAEPSRGLLWHPRKAVARRRALSEQGRRSASTSTRTSRIGTTTRLPSSGRNPPLRSSARGSECLIGSHMRCTPHRSPRR
jgi:transposase